MSCQLIKNTSTGISLVSCQEQSPSSRFGKKYKENDELNGLIPEKYISHKQIWKDIISEQEEKIKEIKLILNAPKDSFPQVADVTYLQKEIFFILLPILQQTILAAKQLNCLKFEKHIFNGIDFLAQQLYNLNPRHSERKKLKQNIYEMDWVQNILRDKARPIFPKSYIWNKEQAAIVIQAYMRGHFVRRVPEVQEMRQFWKTLKRERYEKELEIKMEEEKKVIKVDSIYKLIN